MQLQMFNFSKVRVRGPMGVFEEERMFPAHVSSIVHPAGSWEPDESGWIEVPYDAALDLLAKRFPAAKGYNRYCTPNEVDEQVRLGMLEESALPRRSEPARARAPQRKGAASES